MLLLLQDGHCTASFLSRFGSHECRQSQQLKIFPAAISIAPPSIFNAFPPTKASATFRCADSMILPNVWRETLIFSAAGSW